MTRRRLLLVLVLSLVSASVARAGDPYAGIFFVNPHPEVRQLVNAAGFGLVRMRFLWDQVQTSPPAGCDPHINWNWSDFENQVNAAVADGYTIVVTLKGTPAWANGNQSYNHPPLDPSYFENFTRAVAQHFGSRIKYFDLWNEPDGNTYWTGSRNDYVRLILKPGIKGIHEGWASAKVVAPSTSGAGDQINVDAWVRDTDGSLVPGIDEYSTHLPYTTSDDQVSVLGSMNTWCNNHLPCDGFLVTEFGDNGSDPGGEVNQVLNACASPGYVWCDSAVVFYLHQADGTPGDFFTPFALLDVNGLPKERFCKIEKRNTGVQVAPCPCTNGGPGCS